MYSATDGRSSADHFASAASAAPWMALPDMKVMREAEALPGLPMASVSEVTMVTFSNGMPSAPAAIWAMTVCAPCPTSAPACQTTACSISVLPYSSMRAQEFSW